MESNVYVIDTSIFTNSGSYKTFGNTATLALKNFLLQNTCKVYMPPKCWEELQNFIKINDIPKELLMKIHIKAPNRSDIHISSSIFFDFVCEMRRRSDDSLKMSTNLLKEVYKVTPKKKEKGQTDPDTSYIKRLRDNVRHHTRENFLDSGADLDIILLAKELGARILSSDKGILIWADKFAVEHLPYHFLKQFP